MKQSFFGKKGDLAELNTDVFSVRDILVHWAPMEQKVAKIERFEKFMEQKWRRLMLQTQK